MNRRRLSLALTACALWAGACVALGDEKSTAVPVVYLGRSSAFALPTAKGTVSGRLLGELARQSFLVAARDQLGLRTRDVSLGEEMPGGGDNAPFAIVTVSEKQPALDVRRGFASPGQTLLHESLRAPPPPEQFSKDRFFVPADYQAVLTEVEKLSRGAFVDALKRAGFQGKPNALKDSAGVPPEIAKALEKMDFISQFSAVRQLHELIRGDGQSPERLGALVRGYANLGLLTEFHWHPRARPSKPDRSSMPSGWSPATSSPACGLASRLRLRAGGAAPVRAGRLANRRDAVEGRRERRRPRGLPGSI